LQSVILPLRNLREYLRFSGLAAIRLATTSQF
jgi:hypothetical protein